jgi:hypothetical protein
MKGGSGKFVMRLLSVWEGVDICVYGVYGIEK